MPGRRTRGRSRSAPKARTRTPSRIRRSRPAKPARGVPRRRTAARRTPRRSTSPTRTQRRNVRRQNVRRQAQALDRRPRPVVRPGGRPHRLQATARPRPVHVRPVSGVTGAGRRTSTRPRGVARPRPRGRPADSRAAGVRAAAAGAGAFLLLNTAAAHPDIAYDVGLLGNALGDLQERVSFDEIEGDINELDSDLDHALSLLESAREKGFQYQGDLEDIAYDAMNRWQQVRDDVLKDINRHAAEFAGSLDPIDQQVKQLNAVIANSTQAQSRLRDVRREVDSLADRLANAERAIEKVYGEIEAKVSELVQRLTRIHWALRQLDEASFPLSENENLVMGVAAEWDTGKKDDPEGVLYLTDQRLLFERKEKVATKKVLFITTASEMMQEIVINEPLSEISKHKAHNKGLFGHHDYLEVVFKNKKLGEVNLHINGQSSEYWNSLVTRAKTGKIEDERTSGAGLSFADLTGEVTKAHIVEVQEEINELQDEMMLKDAKDELSELENQAHSLERDLRALRERAYAIEKTLEGDVTVLAMQWERVKEAAEKTIEHQTKLLGEQMADIQNIMADLAGKSGNPNAARSTYVRLKSSIASAEAQAEAAEDTVLEIYDDYADEVETLGAHFEWVEWMLDALSTASFKLLATESGVAATDAVWERSSGEPQNGILFLTDQRLLWEDRTGEFELKLDVPMAHIKEVKEKADENTGQEYLEFTLDSAAAVKRARFALALPVASDWMQMAGRARAGDYADDRAVEIDKAELERIRNAPQQCDICGAPLTQPILRGQTEINCEFCGSVFRI